MHHTNDTNMNNTLKTALYNKGYKYAKITDKIHNAILNNMYIYISAYTYKWLKTEIIVTIHKNKLIKIEYLNN